MNRERDDHTNVVPSSGNVFADLGLPSQEQDMLKVQIAMAISASIEKRKLTQVEAAKIVNSDQARISDLLRGRLKDFSVDRLIQFLVLLGKDIDIKISGNSKQKGQIRVRAA